MTLRKLKLVRLAAGWLTALVAFAAVAPAALAASPSPAPRMELARFGSHSFGGGRGFGPSRSLNRPRLHLPSIRRGFFRRILHALAFAAILHFLFRSAGGLLILLLIVVLVVWLFRRRRRRRAPYGY